MGFKLKDYLYIVPNTDPARTNYFLDLPEDACKIETNEPWLFHLSVHINQYYLAPNTSVKSAQNLHQTSFVKLKRFNTG